VRNFASTIVYSDTCELFLSNGLVNCTFKLDRSQLEPRRIRGTGISAAVVTSDPSSPAVGPGFDVYLTCYAYKYMHPGVQSATARVFRRRACFTVGLDGNFEVFLFRSRQLIGRVHTQLRVARRRPVQE
jgi:hypothetical protein